jgi:3-isopropylmalate/(R)-2-methylmalate dehydratase large subunit
MAAYFADRTYDLATLEPVVAMPHSPDNRALAKDCRDTKIDRVYIGSCTGGKTEDFAAAARVLDGQKVNTLLYFCNELCAHAPVYAVKL